MSDSIQETSENQRDKNERLAQLADQLEAGFEEPHCLKKKGLELARHYGPLLLEWKELVGHGSWQKEVREKVKGADIRTCNRWKRIAEHKAEVEDALARWPEVRWGVVRMLAYLSGKFDPAQPEDYEDEGGDSAPTTGEPQDKADAYGPEADAAVGEGVLVTEADESQGPPDEAIPTPTIRFPSAAQVRPEANGTTHPPSKGKAKRKGKTKLPTVSPTEVVEYEVEIVKVFKVVVPKDTTEECVRTAFENGAVRIQASAEGRPWAFSDEGWKGRLNHVRSWG